MFKKNKKKLDDSRKFVFNIHLRARNNAFAHREAALEAQKMSDMYTKLNLGATATALAFTSFAALLSGKNEIASMIFTLISILSSFCALYTQAILLYKEFNIKAVSHRYFQGSFAYIAQRAREIERPSIDPDTIDSLIDDLERDFALLKIRAIEPQDKHFEKASELHRKIRKNPKYSGALSFEDFEKQEKKKKDKLL